MKLRVLTAVSTVLSALVALSVSVAGLTVGGCGAGGNGATAAQTGLAMTIRWPDVSRVVPSATQSIRVTVQDAGGFQTFRVVNKPTSGTFSTVTFFGLAPGALSVDVRAFPAADAQGVAVAQTTTQVTLAQGAQTSLAVTLASTVSTISLTPASKSVRPGNSVALSAAAKDKDGNIVPLTTAKTQWTSSDTSVATVDSTGKVRGVKAGSATITLTDTESGKAGTATITIAADAPAEVDTVSVSPATTEVLVGATKTLAPVFKDEAGNTLTATSGLWSTSDTAVATVDQAGKVSGVSVGTATITFADTNTGKTATATVTVKAPTLTTVSVAPTSVSLTVGGTQDIAVTFKDEAGNALAATPGTWASSAESLVTVDANGKLTAVAVTASPVLVTFTETATGKSASTSVTVTAP